VEKRNDGGKIYGAAVYFHQSLPEVSVQIGENGMRNELGTTTRGHIDIEFLVDWARKCA